jgi:hypothetical protein
MRKRKNQNQKQLGAGATETLMEIKANNEIRETLFQLEQELRNGRYLENCLSQ